MSKQCVICGEPIDDHDLKFRDELCSNCAKTLIFAKQNLQFLRDFADFSGNYISLPTPEICRKLADYLENPRCDVCGCTGGRPYERYLFLNSDTIQVKGVFCDFCTYVLVSNNKDRLIKIGDYLKQ